jgi:hypothetical protein
MIYQQEQALIGKITSDLIDNHINIRFENKYLIEDPDCLSCSCEGWFAEGKKELVIATKRSREEFIHLLTHEYSHFLQWQQGSDLFKKSGHSELILNNYLDGKKVEEKTLIKNLKIIQKMELECEQMAIELLEKYDFPYMYNSIENNRECLIKQANSYLYFYSMIPYLKGWYITPPQTIKKIIENMPSVFLNIDHITPTEPMIKLYQECMK